MRTALFILILSLATPPALAQEKTRLRWLGDLRLRTQSEKNGGDDARWDELIRLRFGADAAIDDELSATVLWATGKSARSVSQRMGDDKEPGFVRRSVGLDLGYGAWRPAPGLEFDLGRAPQRQIRPGESELLLDEDVALEGVAAVYRWELPSGFALRMAAGSAWIRENYDSYYSDNLTDNKLNWGQMVLSRGDDDGSWSVGTGFYNFVGFQGAAFTDITLGARTSGNSEGPLGFYANRFLVRQSFIEAQVPWRDWDVGVFAEALQNGEVTNDGHATWAGFSLRRGPVQLRLGHAEMQADSTPGIFTDDDFCGGMTDCRGLKFASSWEFARNVRVGLRAVEAIQWLRTTRFHYNRTQLDFAASF